MGSFSNPRLLGGIVPNLANAVTGAVGLANLLGAAPTGWPLSLGVTTASVNAPNLTSGVTGGGIILFEGFEVPEGITAFGGRQTVAIHEFPGAPNLASGPTGVGTRTVETLGAFPRLLTWRGILLGFNSLQQSAAERFYRIDRVKVAGDLLILNWGIYAWAGYLTSWIGVPHSQWRFDYEAEFEPVEDLTAPTPADLPQPPESLLQHLIGEIAKWLGLSGSATSTAATALTMAIGSALFASGGLVSAVGAPTKATLRSDTGAVAAAAKADRATAKSSPTAANLMAAVFSSDLANKAVNADNAFENSPLALTTLKIINPSLPQLAALYYGDARQWPQIAATNNLSNPQPIGIFDLVIPRLG